MSAQYRIVNQRTVIQGKTVLPVLDQPDVVVAGGGPSGVMAAVAAARLGVRVVLVERNAFLGGVATATLMGAFVATPAARGLAREFLDRLSAAGGAPRWIPGTIPTSGTTPFDIEICKVAFLEMVADAGVGILLYTDAVDVIMEGCTAGGVIVESKAGRQAILAHTVIDCTADADLAVRAGAPYVKGREEDGKMRPMALLFRMGGVDLERVRAYARQHPEDVQYIFKDGTVVQVGNEHVLTRVSGFYSLVEQAKARGELPPHLHYFRLEDGWIERGTVICNTTRIYGVDGTDPRDLTRAQIEGYRQMRQVLQFARRYIPGCENAYIIDSSTHIGVRETRRILAEHYVTEDDAYNEVCFPDRVLRIVMSLPAERDKVLWDVHGPDPIEGSKADLLERDPDAVPKRRVSFTLPYRAFLPRQVDGLLVGGRAIGVCHLIDGYTRNMLIAMQTGQIAGTAGALVVAKRCIPRDVDVAALQNCLVQAGIAIGPEDLQGQ